jgi:acyl carrier protein
MNTENLTFDRFVELLEAQFEALPPNSLQSDTAFRELEEWTSMQSLIVIASFDWDHGVTVSADELRAATTIQDLYHLVVSKLA